MKEHRSGGGGGCFSGSAKLHFAKPFSLVMWLLSQSPLVVPMGMRVVILQCDTEVIALGLKKGFFCSTCGQT